MVRMCTSYTIGQSLIGLSGLAENYCKVLAMYMWLRGHPGSSLELVGTILVTKY